jgi:4-amino-4-deoxy-L-arabinose transferase-like glycosyltransferase
MAVMETTMTGQAAAKAAAGTPVTYRTVKNILKNKAAWLVAAAVFGIQLAVSARYGYVRDELYFLSAGAHPAFGYVDQPALTPLLAHLDAVVTGNTLVGLRALPALALAGMVLLTGSMARHLGASSRGQFLAALATACCSQYLGAMHEWTTTVPDFFCWTLLLWLITRLLVSGEPRWWAAIGAVGGIAMSAKWNIGFLVVGLLIGFLLTPAARPLLRGRYLAAGVLLFVLFGSPDFVWQALHGWPNLDVFRALSGDAGKNRVLYWPLQVVYTSIVLVPLWVGGLRWALRDRLLRVVGIAAVWVLVIQFALGGKPYYPGGIFTFCFAAGAAALGTVRAAGAGRAAGARPSWRARARAHWRARAAVWSCAAAAVASLISLPVLPAATLARVPVQKINYDLGEEIGWPSQVQQLAGVWHSLPAPERVRATVIAGNYGEAGAAERYGAPFGLPRVYSGANSFWYWGPPPAADTSAVAINVDPVLLGHWFRSVRQVAVYRNGLGVSDDEEGAVIYVATGLRGSWAAAWPAFRDFS